MWVAVDYVNNPFTCKWLNLGCVVSKTGQSKKTKQKKGTGKISRTGQLG